MNKHELLLQLHFIVIHGEVVGFRWDIPPRFSNFEKTLVAFYAYYTQN